MLALIILDEVVVVALEAKEEGFGGHLKAGDLVRLAVEAVEDSGLAIRRSMLSDLC